MAKSTTTREAQLHRSIERYRKHHEILLTAQLGNKTDAAEAMMEKIIDEAERRGYLEELLAAIYGEH